MTVFGTSTVARSASLAASLTGVALATLGLIAFNLGYVGLYLAFLPLLYISILLCLKVNEDFFLSLLLFAVASSLLYAVGLFALPLVFGGVILSLPLLLLLRRSGLVEVTPSPPVDPGDHPRWRMLELCGLLLVALFARYILYRAGGGTLPLRIGEFESLTRFLISEAGGWFVFVLGYRMQERVFPGNLIATEIDFAGSLPSLLAIGLFLVSPHVAIMTLGLNLFGVTGLYVGSLPVGAAHILMRTLTLRRQAIERQNLRLQMMNAELARNERLAAIGEMSSAISHQLLQKVGLVGLQSSLLRDVLLDDLTSSDERLHEGRERVEQLDESIADLNATLSDLLIFSKEVSLHREACNLTDLLQEAIDEVQATATVRGITLRYRFEADETPLAVDRIKLKQAVLNLLTNAVEVSLVGDQVELIVQTDTTAEVVQIRVSDRGSGIAESNLDHIFAPFFSTKAQGTGLGLTFTQKIVALHGGRVIAHNNPQGGATFIIELPRQSVAERK
jgi:signal transduction histidine kinase